MFSDDNNNLINKKSWISADVTDWKTYLKVILTTSGVVNTTDTSTLMSCVERKLLNGKFPDIHIYTETDIFFYDFPVHDMFKIDNELFIEFWMPPKPKERNFKICLEELNNIYNWHVTVFYSPYHSGRRIYATDLKYDVF